MQENKASLMEAEEIIKKSWQIYKENFKDLLQVLLWVLLPTILLSLLLIRSLGPWSDILYALLTILLLVLGIWINIVFIKLIFKIYNNEKYDLGLIYKESWSKFWNYIAVSAILLWVLAGGYLLFIIPGIIFTVWYSFAAFIVLLDGKKGLTSLVESKKMVMGRFWEILWRWLAPGIFFGIIMILGTLIINSVIGAALGDWSLGLFSGLFWWSDLISNIISMLFTPLFVAIGVILYSEAKKGISEQTENASPTKKPKTTPRKKSTAKKSKKTSKK